MRSTRLYSTRVKLWYVRRHLIRDVARRVRWGRDAPRHAQLVEFDPGDCNVMYAGWKRGQSGQVRDGDWDLDTTPMDTLIKVRACRQHFQDGVPWRETGIYEFMMEEISNRGGRYDGCGNLQDVVRRYERLDLAYEQILREGQLRNPRELVPGFRASSGILVHFGRHAQPIFSGCGTHRLAIAQILRFPQVPAVVGVVHAAAINRTWQSGSPASKDELRRSYL